MARPSKRQRVAPAASAAATTQSKPKSKTKTKSRAVTPAHPPPRQVPCVLGHESPLLPVLRLGDNCVLQFLTLRDAPSLLNCCHAFRRDAELALHALLADPTHRHISAHLQQQCELDWCDLGTLRESTGYDQEHCTHGCFDAVYGNSAEWQAVRAQCAATHRSAMPTQLVTLVAAFNKRVLPLCDSLRELNELVSCGFWSTIPVLIPLMTASSTELPLPDYAVRKALNALHAGFGDAFVRDDAWPFASLFGAHWDNIHESDDDYDSALDEYFGSEGDDSEDDSIETMVATGELRFKPFGRGVRFPPADLVKALESFGPVEICKYFAQPLKRFLLAHCTRVRRVKCPWIATLQTSNKGTVGEFVGGVTASGILCGVLVVNDSE